MFKGREWKHVVTSENVLQVTRRNADDGSNCRAEELLRTEYDIIYSTANVKSTVQNL